MAFLWLNIRMVFQWNLASSFEIIILFFFSDDSEENSEEDDDEEEEDEAEAGEEAKENTEADAAGPSVSGETEEDEKVKDNESIGKWQPIGSKWLFYSVISLKYFILGRFFAKKKPNSECTGVIF